MAEVVRDELTKQRKMLTDGGNVNKEKSNLQSIRDLINSSKDDIISKLG